ncbi:MAG: BspA family leucine-rich repeat surface protein [Acetatifactor sp.]|nr:BspA family leucine-rich repeat surface protein [Acetatifactor sp.]
MKIRKNLFTSFFMLAIVLSMFCFTGQVVKAATSYSFDKGTGVMTLSGTVNASEIKSFDQKSSVLSVVASNGTVMPVNCQALFQNYSKCTKIDLSKADFGKVTTMEFMFSGCSALVTLDLRGSGTSGASGSLYVFHNCIGAGNSPYVFHNHDGEKPPYVFYNSNGQKAASGNLTGVANVFSGCSALTSLTLGSWFTEVTESMGLPNGSYGWRRGEGSADRISGTKTYAVFSNSGTNVYYKILAPKVAKKSLTLYDTIAIEFKLEKAQIDGVYHDPYLTVTQNGKQSKISGYKVSDDGAYYVFSLRVPPHKMGDVATIVPHAINSKGTDVAGESVSYSVAEYCYNMLGKEAYQGTQYAKLRRLLVDILRYGDAAQLYANYKTNALVSAQLTSAQRAMGTDVNVPMVYNSVKDKEFATVSASDALASIERAALFLEAAVNIQFKFSAQSLSGLSVVITDDAKGANVLQRITPTADQIDENKLYYVNVDALNAGQMRKTIYATVMKGNKKVSNTYRYSIESYVQSMKGQGVPNLDGLLDAMMRYGDSAAAYAN